MHAGVDHVVAFACDAAHAIELMDVVARIHDDDDAGHASALVMLVE